jgi:putative ABC transport system substrate-binding protein
MTQFTRRRLLLSTGALLLPPAAWAQAADRVYRVVYLTTFPPQLRARYTDFLKRGLRESGYVEGRNLVFEHRHVDGRTERLPELAREIVRSGPDVIVTGINAQTRAAQGATRAIPIVMIVGTNVVEEGFVASLAHPGGNITGLTWDAGLEVLTKLFEFLKEAVPGLSRVAMLWDPGQDAGAFREELAKAAAAAELDVIWLEVRDDLEPLYATAVRKGAQALLTGGGARLFRWRRDVAELAAKHRLPDAHYDSAFVDAGGFMSYAPSLSGLFARAAVYIDRILKGANPADLPVEQPTQFDLVINLKTARALGLTVPSSLLLRADRLLQ